MWSYGRFRSFCESEYQRAEWLVVLSLPIQRKKIIKMPIRTVFKFPVGIHVAFRSATVSLLVTNVDDSDWMIIFRDIEKKQLFWSQFPEDTTDNDMISSRREIPASDKEKLNDMMCNRKRKCLRTNWTSKRRRIQFHRKSVYSQKLINVTTSISK